MSCKYCGIVNKPHKCSHQRTKWNRDNNRTDKKIYRTMKWQNTRENILKEFNYICLWSFYIDGIITRADTVHHIKELLENESLAYSNDNLIPLRQYQHNYIHELYKTNKDEVQDLLNKMIKSYREGDRTLSKYKSEFKNIPAPPSIFL
ncbi:hypothetical protein [Clostridium butyricum]|nr:hypothetical protein [Clostridium butyricum]